ncbi:MAG: hypothetical protein LBK76_08395 [Verrucomicrobiales bacterium]|nr:hypothetical protein [Verrucomicrobiales bacterium]
MTADDKPRHRRQASRICRPATLSAAGNSSVSAPSAMSGLICSSGYSGSA